MQILIIGGTRNLGPSLVSGFLARNVRVAVLNRGLTPDDLPANVERLRADRTRSADLEHVLSGRTFDLVIDTTLYTGAEAEAAARVFRGRVGRYIFLSTGQVYLVRIGVQRPFREADYDGPVMLEPPKSDDFEHRNWLYGFDKRAAEDVFQKAWQEHRFPYTSLRLPMVNSARDHYNRIYGYFLRLQDGGPILVPSEVDLPLRHVYGNDVVQAVLRLAESDVATGDALNISQDETLALDEFLALMSGILGRHCRIVRVPRALLDKENLLPACSPFSDPWMSSLDNNRSRTELGMRYTPLKECLETLLAGFSRQPLRQIEGYSQRPRELQIAAQHGAP